MTDWAGVLIGAPWPSSLVLTAVEWAQARQEFVWKRAIIDTP